MTYASVIAADSPVAWWRLDETSGTSVADSGSGTADNGTLTGTGTTLGLNGIDTADSGGGTAYKFAGSSYIDCGALASKLQFAIGSSFSIEAWAAFPSTLDTATGPILCEAYAGDGTVRWCLGHWDGQFRNYAAFGWYNGQWRTISDTSTPLNDDLWHHYVGTFDGTQVRLYIDGSLVAGPTTLGGTQPGGNENLYIGRRWDSANYWTGWLDEIAIYSSALSSTQVGNHYAAMNLSTTIGTRVTQTVVEAVVASANPRIRATQSIVEVVTDLDIAGWGDLIWEPDGIWIWPPDYDQDT